jgi:structural maintenance of chromosome 4
VSTQVSVHPSNTDNSRRAQSKPDAADEKRIKTLESDIAGLTKETSKLREKSSSISNEIKALQDQILEVGGVKLRAIQSKVTNTKGLLDLANESITKAEVGGGGRRVESC